MFIILPSPAKASDKSGVKPSAISLPSGAGSIEGLGESFEPQLNTGSSSYGVAIAVPPGRAGLQPKIRLAYNSNLGNSFLGLGWNYEIPTIKRQTDKGFPSYSSADTFIFGGEELVPLSNPDRDWRCENEGAFNRFRQIDTDGDSIPDAWEMTERSGTQHFFGKYRGANNRWSVITHPTPPPAAQNAFDRTYCWALDTTLDLHGNRIDYQYQLASGVLYPSRITYSHLNGNYHEVRFIYGPRPDGFSAFRSTFAITLDHRLERIEVYSVYDGASHLVRAYSLEYVYRPEDGIQASAGLLDLGVSTLKRLVQFDRSGTTNNYLPPLLFEYSQFLPGAARLGKVAPLPNLDLSAGHVQFADMDGDGLPDLVAVGGGVANPQQVCYNLGTRMTDGQPLTVFNLITNMVNPSSLRLDDPESTLTDIDGDGLVDYVRIEPGGITGKTVQIHSNRARLDQPRNLTSGFSEAATGAWLHGPIDISFADANVRQMDVNFDKISDFVKTSYGFPTIHFTFYWIDRPNVWHSLEDVSARNDMAGFDLRFALDNGQSNPQVKLVDMNGDRLLDLVYLEVEGTVVRTLKVHYWPYSGLGQWGEHRLVSFASGESLAIGTLKLENILVQDFSGDGLADLVLLETGSPSSIQFFANIAGNHWSQLIPIDGLPRYEPANGQAPTIFRQADINGNGSTDLIWRNQFVGGNTLEWLDFIHDAKPNLLTCIDNGLGKITEITYGSSTDDMIRAREKGYPWQTKCPFPVQVVRRIRTTSGLDLDGVSDADRQDAYGEPFTTDQYVSEFHYRDAYYDGFEKEFRGFAFAERIDYGDDFLMDTNLTTMTPSSGWDRGKTPTGQISGPSLVTRFRFLTGASDQKDNDEYPLNWNGPRLIDEITEKGGREEEVLKGCQVWEEKVDPWVLHDLTGAGNFDRSCYLAVMSTNAYERQRMTPDNFVYTRTRQDWTIRRLYRPNEAIPYQAQNANGVLVSYPVALLTPPGRFESTNPTVHVLPGSGHTVSYAFVSRVETETIEANGVLHSFLGYPIRDSIVTLSMSDSDDYGNQVLSQNYGVTNNTSYNDERFTRVTYALGGEALARWIIIMPAAVRISDEAGRFVAQTNFFYDGSPFVGLAAGSVGSRGLLHRVEQVVTSDTPLPNITEQSDLPGDPRLPAGKTINIARNQYDLFGNAVVHLDPLGKVDDLSSGHARRIDYDSQFQTYPVKENIFIGQNKTDLAIEASYDAGFGVVTKSTDFNGNDTLYEYDSFARLVAIIKPFDTVAQPTALFQYLPADPNRGRIYVYDRAGNLKIDSPGFLRAASRVVSRLRETSGQDRVYVTVSYSDGFGRKLAQMTEDETPGCWVVSKATTFNRRLSVQSEWLPYRVTFGDDDSTPPQFGTLWPAGRPPEKDTDGKTVVKSDKFYDPLGRQIIAINAPETWSQVGNETVRTRSQTQILPLETRLFDENDLDSNSAFFSTPMVHFQDGLGRLIKVQELARLNDDGAPSGSVNTWTTTYSYDLNDNLTHILDSQNNQKWFRYDGLGRKIFMNDPDRGVMHFVYDDASNLKETTDAKGQRISYTYDGVNRILTEDYQDDNSAEFSYRRSPDVAYHYDLPVPNLSQGDNTQATARNVKGTLAWVEDASGEEHTSLDARGRTEWIVKRLPDPVFKTNAVAYNPGMLVSYRTAFEYDSLDRVKTITYPDLDQIAYEYNGRNLVRRIPGGPSGSIISNIAYRPSGQMAHIDYGNGVSTTYQYDPRLRLNDLFTRQVARNAELIHFTYEFDGVSNIKAIADQRPGTAVPAGDPRRNTQIFQYDDLYRLTRVQFSFNLPNADLRNDGVINYRYDRIGNMLAQTSTLDHQQKGLPVANLGEMESGGSSGRSSRIGRKSNDVPGPHALTRILNPKSQISNREYPYDANGNMTVIDGLTNTWDFKDRLVCVENAEMRADYTYDYTDRRVIKNVSYKPGSTNYANHDAQITTLYVNKYFEVREHDAPTKYVWNADTRVAHVTGSLNTNTRVQRLRVYPGWNLCSVAVTTPASALSLQSSAFRWERNTLSWLTVSSKDILAAGTVLWIKASTNSTLSITGTYSDPTNRIVTASGDFLPSAGLEAWCLTNSVLSVLSLTSSSWFYDTEAIRWLISFPPPLQLQSDLPPFISPGQSVFARADTPVQLEVPEFLLRIRYYHQDHLGSSSVITDTAGQLVEETANYAFGHPRLQIQSRGSYENYQFTQNERDIESGLHDYKSRFLAATFGRFTRIDTLAASLKSNWFTTPQTMNLYAYSFNNPIRFVDPTGFSPNENMATGFGLDIDPKTTPFSDIIQSKADWYYNKAMEAGDRGAKGSDLFIGVGAIMMGSIIESSKDIVVTGLEQSIRTGYSSRTTDQQKLLAAGSLAWDHLGVAAFRFMNKADRLIKFPSMHSAFGKGLGATINQAKFWLTGDRFNQSSIFRGNVKLIEQLDKGKDAMELMEEAGEKAISAIEKHLDGKH